MANQQTGQIEQANAALVSLAEKITTSDRQAAMVTYSHFTVSQYLNGKGKNLDTAMNLLRLFKGRIEDRQRELTGLDSDEGVTKVQ